MIAGLPEQQCGSLTSRPVAPILSGTPEEPLPMADCDDPFACAVREVTRRGGRTIWSDPGRLRSRLQYEMGAVSGQQSAVLDALVIAALQGIPSALLDQDDLEPLKLSLSEAVGPALAAEAVSAWTWALAEPELACGAHDGPLAFVIDRAPGRLVIDVESVEVRVLEPGLSVEAEPVVEERVLTLMEKLRPPPPVPVSA